MHRKPDITQAYFLTPGARPADPNSYRPCTIHSITPKHYNITYTTPDGHVHHVRCAYATIYTEAEKLARTRKNLFQEVTDYLVGPGGPCYLALPPSAADHYTPIVDDDPFTMMNVVRMSLAAAEHVITQEDPDTWRNWCCDLLNTLDGALFEPAVDADDFLLRVQCALTSRIETGHW